LSREDIKSRFHSAKSANKIKIAIGLSMRECHESAFISQHLTVSSLIGCFHHAGNDIGCYFL
jgi:hypothetical protein